MTVLWMKLKKVKLDADVMTGPLDTAMKMLLGGVGSTRAGTSMICTNHRRERRSKRMRGSVVFAVGASSEPKKLFSVVLSAPSALHVALSKERMMPLTATTNCDGP